MKNNLLKIIDHYGINNQLRKFNEESFELQEAILNAEFDRMIGVSNEPCLEAIIHITEEITDCYVMLEQFRHYYRISNEELEKIMKYKIERQLERMENESNR